MTMASRYPRDWMWSEACELLARADRLQRQFFQIGSALARRPMWEPPVDILETDGDLVVLVALPGVAPERVEVVLEGSMVSVAGERRLPIGAAGTVIRRLEIPHGRFERRVAFDGRRLELTRREFANGCLHLVFRKLD